MPIEWDPLPDEALPPGWSVDSIAADRLVYRWDEPDLALEAIRTEADHTHPVLGIPRCWELRLCYSIGESSGSDRVARVSTRAEVQEELRSCMEFFQNSLSETNEPIAALRALRTQRSR